MEEAKAAAVRGEVPIGAVLVEVASGRIVEAAGNRTREKNDPTAHAEIEVIRAGCAKTGAQRIPDHDLYVTLEPCTMCAAAISFARIRRVIFAAADAKGGGVLHGAKFFGQATCHWRPEVVQGPLTEESTELLRGFFRERRDKNL